MKLRRPTAASLDDNPAPLSPRVCEHSGCHYVGEPRLQVGGRHAPRLIYLCSLCLDSMPVDQLRDLCSAFRSTFGSTCLRSRNTGDSFNETRFLKGPASK